MQRTNLWLYNEDEEITKVNLDRDQIPGAMQATTISHNAFAGVFGVAVDNDFGSFPGSPVESYI